MLPFEHRPWANPVAIVVIIAAVLLGSSISSLFNGTSKHI